MSSTDISFAAYQGDGTNVPVVRSGDNPVTIRMYKAASGKSTGGYLTLTAKVGCTIDQVKIEFSGNADAAYCKDAEALPTSKYIEGESELLTPTGLDAQSVSIVNLKNDKIDVATITVWYNGDPLAVHHYILGGTYPTEFEQHGTFSYEGLTVTAAYDAEETITEPVSGFEVIADLSTAGAAKAEVYLGEDKLTEYDITVTPTAKSDPEIGWSPSDNIVLTEGDEFTAPTWQNPHSVSVSFESTNTSVATVSNAGVITIEGLGTTTISATFAGDETYYSANPSITVTVNAAVEDLMGKWVVATSVAAGDRIIIANVAEGTAVKTMGSQNNNNRAAVASAVDGEGIMTPAEGTKVFTLVDAGDGKFAIQALNGKYLTSATSGTDNKLLEADDYEKDNAKWTISIDGEGVASVVAAAGSRTYMKYNNGSTIFSCYQYSTSQQPINIYKIKPDVLRDGLGVDKMGTICPKQAVKNPTGASFYTISYVEKHNGVPYKVFYDEIAEGASLEAGRPYIFIANGEEITGVKFGAEASEGINDHGFIGKVAQFDFYVDNDAVDAHQYYIVKDNSIRLCGTGWFRVGAERAYLDMSDETLVTTAQAPAPGRRRVCLTNQEAQVATGMENAQSDQVQSTKVLIDGQLFIIRGEKMYNANGQVVK